MANYVLEILDGDRAGDVLPVGEQSIRIGRKPGNDIVLADEKTSGVHCEIVREGDRHVLRDLGSTNGTFLDGKRVTELVLTPGDVVTVGRLRVTFRIDQEAGGEGSDLAVHRLDAGRLGKKRGSAMGLVVLLLVVAVGGGGWYWWQGNAGQVGQGTAQQRQRPQLQVAGNKLAASIAGCEDDTGWTLAAAGSGFQASAATNTGRGAFVAMRGEAAESPDFAMLTLAEAMPVFAGRSFTLAAHLRSRAGALVGLRCVCFSNADAQPFRFRQGTALQAHEEWSRVEFAVTVPPGCDRMQIEVVALLGGAEAAAEVDDVAVTEGGGGAAVDLDLEESKQKALGTAAALAVRSTDTENPATLLEVLPGDAPDAFAGLAAAGLLALSDLGAKLAIEANEASFSVRAEGVNALELVFPAEAAGSLLGFDVAGAAVAGQFESVAAESTFTAKAALLGERATRALARLQSPTEFRGKLGGGLYRLRVASNEFELVLGFRSERLEAGALLSKAKTAAAAGQPGDALDELRTLVDTVPQHSETLGQAQELRANLMATQADTLGEIGRDLEEAEFFDTRGGFERVVARLDEMVGLYREANLEGKSTIVEYRERAATRLAALQAAAADAEKSRLQALAKAFEAAQETALAQLVQAYLQR